MDAMDGSVRGTASQDLVAEKIREYERFLGDRLQTDLRLALAARDRVYARSAEYLRLRSAIEAMQASGAMPSGVSAMVDLGCNFYAQARVEDASHIYVEVGFGFYVQFTAEEALAFIDKKTAQLNGSANDLSAQAAKIRAHIKLVLEALQELQFGGARRPQQRIL